MVIRFKGDIKGTRNVAQGSTDYTIDKSKKESVDLSVSLSAEVKHFSHLRS